MNPDDIIQIGPLALALDRLVAIGLILAFLTVVDRIVQRHRMASWQPTLALLAGLVAARACHVWHYRESYALEPVVALQVWLGGWDWPLGVAGAGAVLALMMRSVRPVAGALATLGVLAAIWAAFLAVGDNKPPLRLPQTLTLQGPPASDGNVRPLRLGDLRGRPLVLNLWATWCPPCRREMPMLTNVARTEQRATIILANQGEQPAQVVAFLRAQGLNAAHIALDPSSLLTEVAEARALPTTLFIDSDGTVRQVHTGEINRVQLDIAIRALAERK